MREPIHFGAVSSAVLLLHVVAPSEAEWCVSQITEPGRSCQVIQQQFHQPAKSVLSIWRRTHSIRATYRHGTHRQAPQRRSFALGVFHSTKLQAQIADEQQQRNAELPPLGALVVNVDVGDREVGPRRVGRPAEPASDHHALKGSRGKPARAWDVDRRAREVARKSIVVEGNGAVVLGGDVDVLRKGTAGDEACTF